MIVPKNLSPKHYQVLWLWLQGLEIDDIEIRTGVPKTHIGSLVKSQEAQDLLQKLVERNLDTIAEVQQSAQAVAPAVFEEKVRLALNSHDQRVRNTACTDILAMAGHSPVKRVHIERADPELKKYAEMSEEQLRAQILGELGIPTPAEAPEPEPTVH